MLPQHIAAGEHLYSEYYDEISDYTRKGGVLHTEILLPAHAPECFRDRATLWNAVEAAERHPKAQLAYSFDIALQNELSLNENIELARAFVQKEFVDRGMIADLAIHSPDKTGGIPNPHMHVMTTMRPLNPDGSFAPKQRREYVLDASGKPHPRFRRSLPFQCRPYHRLAFSRKARIVAHRVVQRRQCQV